MAGLEGDPGQIIQPALQLFRGHQRRNPQALARGGAFGLIDVALTTNHNVERPDGIAWPALALSDANKQARVNMKEVLPRREADPLATQSFCQHVDCSRIRPMPLLGGGGQPCGTVREGISFRSHRRDRPVPAANGSTVPRSAPKVRG
jgi:hypothetical protein